jgi:hypothetical protein
MVCLISVVMAMAVYISHRRGFPVCLRERTAVHDSGDERGGNQSHRSTDAPPCSLEKVVLSTVRVCASMRHEKANVDLVLPAGIGKSQIAFMQGTWRGADLGSSAISWPSSPMS